MLETKKIIV